MNRKGLKQQYRLTELPAGVYQIRNLINGKLFLGSSVNLPGRINRETFQLKVNAHKNKVLQSEWTEFGAENFVIEILEELVPRENLDQKRELEFLEDLWLEKLKPFDTAGYNEPKKTREERLRMISAKRNL